MILIHVLITAATWRFRWKHFDNLSKFLGITWATLIALFVLIVIKISSITCAAGIFGALKMFFIGFLLTTRNFDLFRVMNFINLGYLLEPSIRLKILLGAHNAVQSYRFLISFLLFLCLRIYTDLNFLWLSEGLLVVDKTTNYA